MPIPPPTRPSRRPLWLVGASSLIGLVAILGWAALRSTAPQPPPVPDPNGYDDLIAAARSIVGPPPADGDIAGADPEALRDWVLANREALDAADRALDLPSGVPLTFTWTDVEAAMADIGRFRLLARLMLADALVALDEGRSDDAADRAFDLIRLARQSSRNGLLLHRQVAVAIERMGLDGLRRTRDGLDESRSRALVRALLELDRTIPDADAMLALEAEWSRAATPRNIRVAQAVVPGVRSRLRALAAPAEAALGDALLRQSGERRRLAIDLAIRSYQGRRGGRPPDRLEDLVPGFLPVIPRNPSTEEPPFYEPAEDGASFLLHFLGPDGRDDGGQPVPPRSDPKQTPGDLVSDPPIP